MIKLALKGLIKLAKITGQVEDVQQWLDKKYSTSESKLTVEKLTINDEFIYGGSLSLIGFNNLTEFASSKGFFKSIYLDCPNLKILKCGVLDYIKINCPNLEELKCSEGSLTSLEFLTKLNPEKLRILSICENNLSNDLSFFSSFTNLEVLKIGGYHKDGPLEHFNNFYGSLAPLKKLTKLRELRIDCTDIDSGLEYLPESLEIFTYSLKHVDKDDGKEYERSDAKVKKIIKRLEPYNGDWKKWQADHLDLMIKANPERTLQKIQDLEEQQSELLDKLNNSDTTDQIIIEKLLKELQEIKQERDLLQTKLNEVLNHDLSLQLEVKESQLNKLKGKFNEEEFATETLLEATHNLASYDISVNKDKDWKDKERSINHLAKKGFKQEDIDNLCNLQSEITQLKLQLENLKPNKQLLLTNNQREKLLLEFNEYPIFTKELLNKINNYLQSKEEFISCRKETIILLQEVVNLIERKTVLNSGKYVRIEDGINIIKPIFKITDIATPMLGANEIPGEVISIVFNHFKRRFNEKNSEIFKQHLTKSDNISELNKQRGFLLEIINKHPNFNSSQSVIELFNLNDSERIFNEEYEIYRVATNIWANKVIITVDDMKTAISDLTKNINLLEREFKQERKEITKLSGEMTNLEQQVISCSIQQA